MWAVDYLLSLAISFFRKPLDFWSEFVLADLNFSTQALAYENPRIVTHKEPSQLYASSLVQSF